MKPILDCRGKLYLCLAYYVLPFICLATILFIINVSKGYAQSKQAPGRETTGQPVAESSPSLNPPIEELRIGDKVPEEVWNLPLKVANHLGEAETVTLEDYRGKLIILEFWAKWCSSCIAAFPKLDKLARQFSEKVFILPIGNEPACVQIFERQRTRHNLKLSASSSSALFDYFDIYGVPHAVIIDKDGTLLASTYGEYVTAENIKALLNGEAVTFPRKASNRVVTENKKALRDKKRRLDAEGVPVLFRSVLTPYQPTLNRGTSFLRHKGVRNGIRFFNMSGMALYLESISEDFPSYPMNRVVLEIEDPSRLLDSMYCYELVVPLARAADLKRILREEADQLFGYASRIEKRRTECLAIVLTSPEKPLMTKGGEPEKNFSDSSYTLKNMGIDELVKSLGFRYRKAGDLPVVDATGLSYNVDLDFNADLKEMEAVRTELQKYGLDLQEKDMEIDMLVISEQN